MARPAVPLEIARRRNKEPLQRHDLLANDAFAADIGRLNANVVAFLDRIVDAVVVMQLDDQIGMLLLEAANVAREHVGEEGGDATDAQGAGEPNCERAYGRLRFVELGDDAHAALEITRSSVGQRQPARGTDQKLCLEPLFQLAHPLGDDRFGQSQPAGRSHEAATFDHANEHADAGQFVHVIVLDSRTICFQTSRLSSFIT